MGFFSNLLSAKPTKKELDYIVIPTSNKINFIKNRDIVYLQSDGKYTTFHFANNKEILTSKNIGEYEKTLNKNRFFRIHNSYIINIEYVLNINKRAGNYCEMVDGKFLPVATRRISKLVEFLKNK